MSVSPTAGSTRRCPGVRAPSLGGRGVLPSPNGDSKGIFIVYGEKASLFPDISLLSTCNRGVTIAFGAERQLTLAWSFYSLQSRIGAP